MAHESAQTKQTCRAKVWPQLIRLRNEGLIGALGVSNFGAHQLEGMRPSAAVLTLTHVVGHWHTHGTK